MGLRHVLAEASIFTSVLAACYFPDGSLSPADVACNPGASDSACCYHDQACLSNGLCQTGNVSGVLQYARGTCTDPNWESGACPNFCTDQKALGNPVFSCNITGQDKYCCNENCGCSENGINQIVSFSGVPYTLTVIDEAGTYPTPSATASSTSSPATSSTPSPTSSGTSTSASSTPSHPASSSSSGSRTSATSLGVGIGVGVGGALLLLGAGACFIHRRRTKANKRRPQLSDEHSYLAPAYSDNDAHLLEALKRGDNVTSPAVASELDNSTASTELPVAFHQRAELPS